jgi:hypothetical protein
MVPPMVPFTLVLVTADDALDCIFDAVDNSLRDLAGVLHI